MYVNKTVHALNVTNLTCSVYSRKIKLPTANTLVKYVPCTVCVN